MVWIILALSLFVGWCFYQETARKGERHPKLFGFSYAFLFFITALIGSWAWILSALILLGVLGILLEKSGSAPLPPRHEDSENDDYLSDSSRDWSDGSLIDNPDEQLAIYELDTGMRVRFWYTNASGEYSEREVSVTSYDGEILEAWDLKKQDERTFLADSIENGIVTNMDTGKVIDIRKVRWSL